jgi:3-methyladenine DNA glycosylase/8-oxoguanine DNA glycosylase
MRGAGLSRAKLTAVRDLADRAESGALRLQGLGRLPDDAILERLVQVRGIGPWTAQMFLMFKLGRLDVLPVGDLGVQEGLRILDGRKERPGPVEVEERGAVWAPLRSVATWIMWRLVDETPTT